MLEFIQEVIYQITGKRGVTYDTDFVQDLAINSLDVMNIIGKFEDRFDITIPTRDVWQLHQVKDVIGYLARRGITQP
jgi:acyl carrier protein